jgi:hypothetical protein
MSYVIRNTSLHGVFWFSGIPLLPLRAPSHLQKGVKRKYKHYHSDENMCEKKLNSRQSLMKLWKCLC